MSTENETHPQRIEIGLYHPLKYFELRHPFTMRTLGDIRQLVQLLLALHKVSPPETENEKHRLRDSIEHAVLCQTRRVRAGPCDGIEDVEAVVEEIAETRDRLARALTVDENGAADEARNVARRRDTGHGGLVFLQQRFGDQHALEQVTELGVERGEPEHQKLGISGLEGTENRALEDGKEGEELGALEGLQLFDILEPLHRVWC